MSTKNKQAEINHGPLLNPQAEIPYRLSESADEQYLINELAEMADKRLEQQLLSEGPLKTIEISAHNINQIRTHVQQTQSSKLQSRIAKKITKTQWRNIKTRFLKLRSLKTRASS